ncbi:hypothetical protein AAJ76_220001562 [Vairimorpha ceranae]|uniref:Uncharacterized protein n=1 Tax=Vairimorpha ceranae TaxID=40302 RepID=A0A0F9WR56_9MICR|nr:hypothetical protein AAJ76_220001562 [Vairimorpha ceranae]KAF5140606.1 hypothetical protein G9O61_00g014110 [Vairimorpha ceranae]KKO75388.1 hypothetical protein AAJ76_220001562 [Vairimorpha ceranae]
MCTPQVISMGIKNHHTQKTNKLDLFEFERAIPEIQVKIKEYTHKIRDIKRDLNTEQFEGFGKTFHKQCMGRYAERLNIFIFN